MESLWKDGTRPEDSRERLELDLSSCYQGVMQAVARQVRVQVTRPTARKLPPGPQRSAWRHALSSPKISQWSITVAQSTTCSRCFTSTTTLMDSKAAKATVRAACIAVIDSALTLCPAENCRLGQLHARKNAQLCHYSSH